MANKYLDSEGLAILWERIQQLVYTCGSRGKVTYRLESNGNKVSLIGSDGSVSTVEVTATASCE